MSVHSEVDRILDYARVRAPGASDNGIKQAFYEATTEFFRFTSAWKASVSFSTLVNEQTYQLSVPPPGQVIRLIGVCDQYYIPWAAAMPLGQIISPGTPPTTSEVATTPGTIQLFCAPTTVQTLYAQFVMNVTLPTDGNSLPEVPDWTLPLYSSVFIDGTLGYLLMQPKKPYTDLPTSTYHLRKFNDGKANARTATLRMNTQATQSWRFPGDWCRGSGQRGGVSVGNANTF